MMRRQTLIALGIAIVLGIVAVYLANIYLSRSEQRAEAVAARAQTTKVAVAAVPLEYGTEITPEKVRFVDYPAASLPPGSYRTMAQLLPAGRRRVALTPMVMNEPILAPKITGEGEGASLAALLPDGKRAASVRINDVSGVSGFIEPNDAVDVLVTRQVGGGGREVQLTDVLLQDIRVIAIGQDNKGKDGKPALAKTATLEVDPVDAQKLALAQQVGTLSLVLRKPGEEQNNPMLQTVSLNDLRYGFGGSGRYTPQAAPAPARSSVVSASRNVRRSVGRALSRPPVMIVPRPSTSSVQVVRGTEGSNYEVGDYGS